MGTRQIGLQDVSHGRPPSRLRLLAPLRYLSIQHPEKTAYDFVVPAILAVCGWGVYTLISPRFPIFSDDGLLRFTRDLLIMSVPFMVGALAAVAMGSPGAHLDRRPLGPPLFLDGELLTLRQFVCYLLGYLSFLGLVTLGGAVVAELMHKTVVFWLRDAGLFADVVRVAGAFVLSALLSSLTVTVLWSLYFLTEVVNQKVG